MRGRAVAGAAGLVLALVVAACGGGGGGNKDDAESTDSDRCDLGFNTAKFNETTDLVDEIQAGGHEHMAGMGAHYTTQEWAEAFAPASVGFDAGQLVSLVDSSLQLRMAVESGGMAPRLTPDPWVPMTDRDDCAALADQLRQARQVATRYPTAADALADGYEFGSQAAIGQGAHYTKLANITGSIDVAHPGQLMFAGNEDTATLVGMAYIVPRGDNPDPPDGLIGPNDQWHLHSKLCENSEGTVIGGDLSAEQCASIGGTVALVPANGIWMLHVWVVPGCESDWGMFSGANPRYGLVPPGASYDSGCNTGRTLTEPLDLADPAGGPDISS